MSNLKSIPLWVFLGLCIYSSFPNTSIALIFGIIGSAFVYLGECYFLFKRDLVKPKLVEKTELMALREQQEVEQLKLNIQKLELHGSQMNKNAISGTKSKVSW